MIFERDEVVAIRNEHDPQREENAGGCRSCGFIVSPCDTFDLARDWLELDGANKRLRSYFARSA